MAHDPFEVLAAQNQQLAKEFGKLTHEVSASYKLIAKHQDKQDEYISELAKYVKNISSSGGQSAGGYQENPFKGSEGAHIPVAMYNDAITGKPEQSLMTNIASQVGFLSGGDIWGSITRWFTYPRGIRDAELADKIRCRTSPCDRKLETHGKDLLWRLDMYNNTGMFSDKFEEEERREPTEEEMISSQNARLELRIQNRELMNRYRELDASAAA